MRLGFFIGFLIGAGIASLMTMLQEEEPSAVEDVTDDAAAGSNPLDALKRQAREAREAGRQAAADKQAEMMHDWEEARHRAP
jgi:hypothetical protein